MMPGLVDTSVHIQDPGRGEWEGFAAATKAAGLYFEWLNNFTETWPMTIMMSEGDLFKGRTYDLIALQSALNYIYNYFNIIHYCRKSQI